MKTVHILMGENTNGVESWHWIIDVYADLDSALYEQIRLECENDDGNISYFIKDHTVK